MMIYRTAAACGIALEMYSHISGQRVPLPFAGDPLQQLGIVFGIAFIAAETSEIVSQSLQSMRRLIRKHFKKSSPKASQSASS